MSLFQYVASQLYWLIEITTFPSDFLHTSNLNKTTDNSNNLFLGRKRRKMKQVLKIVNKITKEDIQNFAKQVLEEKNFVVGAIGKDVNINDLKVFKK